MDILQSVSDISAIGVAGLALVALVYFLKQRKQNGDAGNNDINSRLTKIETNHLHTMTMLLEEINQKLNSLDRIDRKIDSIREDSVYIKTRINGYRR